MDLWHGLRHCMPFAHKVCKPLLKLYKTGSMPIHTHIDTCKYTHIYMYIYIYMHVCVYMYLPRDTYVYISICTYRQTLIQCRRCHLPGPRRHRLAAAAAEHAKEQLGLAGLLESLDTQLRSLPKGVLMR